MKRALAVLAFLCTVAFAGFSQYSGSWDLSICTDGTLSSNLTINYEIMSGLTVSSVSSFDETGWISQKFTLKGALGPFSLSGSMTFDPADVVYLKSQLKTSLDFAGMALGLTVDHYGPAAGSITGCQTNEEGQLKYTLTAKVDPISATIIFLDCCTGTEFGSLLVKFPVPLCCGLSFDAEFSFTKAGFDYLELSGLKIPLCCGVYAELGILFTTDAKTVSVDWGFEGLPVEGCFEIYGAAETSDNIWEGIRVDGFKIACTLGDCSGVEFVTFLAPEYAADYGYDFLTACGEFEYIGFNFCGAGCCGGQWTAGIDIYFGTLGGLFDVTRIAFDFSIPLSGGIALTVSGYVPAATCAGTMSLCGGITFSF